MTKKKTETIATNEPVARISDGETKLTLNLDGVEIEVAEEDLSSYFGRMMFVQGMTLSHSRKLNTEDHQKYTSEDFFESASLDFGTVWQAIPRAHLVDPVKGPIVWKAFLGAMNEKVGKLLILLQRNVLYSVTARAKQLGLRVEERLQQEVNLVGRPGGFDPLSVLPREGVAHAA